MLECFKGSEILTHFYRGSAPVIVVYAIKIHASNVIIISLHNIMHKFETKGYYTGHYIVTSVAIVQSC